MSESDQLLEGLFPAIVTPFTSDGEAVDADVLRQVVNFQIDAGVGGVIACGSTGEFMNMTKDERKQVAEVSVDAAAGRVPVVVHTAALTTKEAVDLSGHAERAGAAAVMVIPPYYEPITWTELLAHFRAISDAISIPIMYYHMPSATGMELTMGQFEELAAIENIRYTKDSSGNAVQILELFEEMPDKLTVFNGEDKLTMFALAHGSRGSVWGAATFFPGLAVELFDAIVKRESLPEARDVWSRIWPIMATMGEIGYQSAVKAGCELVGLPVGVPRLPLLPAPAEFSTKLADVLRASGVTTTAAVSVGA